MKMMQKFEPQYRNAMTIVPIPQILLLKVYLLLFEGSFLVGKSLIILSSLVIHELLEHLSHDAVL